MILLSWVLATDVCILIVYMVINNDMDSLEVLDARGDVRLQRACKDNPIVPEIDKACSTYITILKQTRGNLLSMEDPSSDLGKAYWKFWDKMDRFNDLNMWDFYDDDD